MKSLKAFGNFKKKKETDKILIPSSPFKIKVRKLFNCEEFKKNEENYIPNFTDCDSKNNDNDNDNMNYINNLEENTKKLNDLNIVDIISNLDNNNNKNYHINIKNNSSFFNQKNLLNKDLKKEEDIYFNNIPNENNENYFDDIEEKWDNLISNLINNSNYNNNINNNNNNSFDN
jgi:hypothetical protein